MFIIANIVGIFVFLGIAYAFSNDRKNINWKSIIVVLIIQVVLAWFFTTFSMGRDMIKSASDGFTWLVNIANQGISFAVPDWLHSDNGGPNFVTAALLPILLIVPLFDILTYIGLLPWVIKWLGKGLSYITGQPNYESFFAIEMMFLGNTEVLAVSKHQLETMSNRRNFTLALMSMSCVTASIIGAYVKMVPGDYVLTAIPLNILGAIIVSSILNPVKIDPEEDTIAEIGNGKEKEPFFSFLGDSILNGGKLILIIAATVISFVSLAGLINEIFALTGLHWLTLQNILGVIMFPFAWLLGFNVDNAFQIAQYMGTKLITNEFVVMGEISKNIMTHKDIFASKHASIVLTVFLTSFANFGTLGMIVGTFKGLVSKNTTDYISKRVPYMFLSGILVSLLSAGMAGLFVW